VVISTVRADGSVQSSLVNAGVMPHPITGKPCLAFVTYGKVKLANLRRRPHLAATVRAGWEWASVEGRAEIIGPDDPHDALDSDRLRLLLRQAFACAGGTHDDWAEYDRVTTEQGRGGSTATHGRERSPTQPRTLSARCARRDCWSAAQVDGYLKPVTCSARFLGRPAL
jgi:PPOX class probable F420-dependent enzyme